jgi:hypothetical protein
MAKTMKFDYPYLEDFGAELIHLMDRPEPDVKEWTALNPSVGYSEEDGHICLIRSSNYVIEPVTRQFKILTSGDIRTHVWICSLDSKTWEVSNLRQIEIIGGPAVPRGIEDARLYRRNGEWYMHGVMLERAHTVPARIATYKLDLEKNEAHFIEKLEGPSIDRPEKNWMTTFGEANPNFDFIYSPTGIMKNNLFISRPNTNEEIAQVRGGSSLLELGDSSYLAVTHTVFDRREIKYEDGELRQAVYRNYVHQFVRYDSFGKIIELSPEFLFEGYAVEFAAGLADAGDNFVISYGIEDSSANLAVIPKKNVMAMLYPADETEDW